MTCIEAYDMLSANIKKRKYKMTFIFDNETEEKNFLNIVRDMNNVKVEFNNSCKLTVTVCSYKQKLPIFNWIEKIFGKPSFYLIMFYVVVCLCLITALLCKYTTHSDIFMILCAGISGRIIVSTLNENV